MGRAVLMGCLPWFALLVGLFVCLLLVVRVNGARLRLGRLGQLHRDEGGSAQALSFVATLPFFIMVVLLILQVSQLMIGKVVVEYAALAAARTAIVWIPARVGAGGVEAENCISAYGVDPSAPDQVFPVLNPADPNYGPAGGGLTFLLTPGSTKHRKIERAAVLACMPISPSRDLESPWPDTTTDTVLKDVYRSMVPDYDNNARIAARLKNKLLYSSRATEVEVRFFHSNQEPPLVPYLPPIWTHLYDAFHPPVEFQFNEIGWQDPVTVTVRHDLALLPGPGHLLLRYGEPGVRQTTEYGEACYVYPLKATATLGNEGQKPMVPYVHEDQD